MTRPEARSLARLRRLLWTPGRWSPRGQNEPRLLPVPWVLDDKPDGEETAPIRWTQFNPNRSYAGHRRIRCQVCGIKVPAGRRIHLSIGGPVDLYTSGPAVHPLCALFTIRFCPHFRDENPDPDTIIGWLWTGTGQGYGANGTLIADLLDGDGASDPRPGSQPITYADLRRLAAAS